MDIVVIHFLQAGIDDPFRREQVSDMVFRQSDGFFTHQPVFQATYALGYTLL